MRSRKILPAGILVVLAIMAGAAILLRGAPPWLTEALNLLAKRSATTAEPAGSTGTERLYQCSMHPQIVSREPGLCPICRMQLTPVEDAGAHGADAATHAPASAAGKRTILFYRHPMRADVTSPVPAKDEMGMDYVPVYAEDVSPGGSESVAGRASFTLPIERQQLIGVTKAPVERRPLVLEIRTVGKVAYDPGLYQAVVEYREAIVARGQLAESPWPDARRGADAIVRAAHLKLRQQGLSDDQIRQMAAGGGDPVELLLPGKSVWVYAQVYEYEVELIRPGQPLVITAPSLPGRTWTAAVAAVDPILNPQTRTARVRARVETPDASLKPEMFVHARIEVSLGEQLAVPEEAVLYTGEDAIVFVVEGEGTFEPRAVRLGRTATGYSEVLAGLAEGEQVVTSANFLIDSESRFRAALAAFGKKAGAAHAH
jgi:multidrug efflux pump subunit AcrA (membrane-fusion protein)